MQIRILPPLINTLEEDCIYERPDFIVLLINVVIWDEFILFIFRDAGVTAIENLMKRKGKFDCILLEMTGLADPGPIASVFWLDEGLGSEIMLDDKEIWKAKQRLYQSSLV